MGERDYQNITEEEIDMLREAGNIASGNAMTSLGKLIGCTLDMNVVKVRIEKIQELTDVLGDAEEFIAGMLINVYGDLNAMLLLALEADSAIKVVNRMLSKEVSHVEEFDEIDISVLCETGNILAGSYLSALNTFTGLELDVSTPQISIDMAGAILSYPAIEFAKNDNSMLFIETEFRDTNQVLNGTYILILDNDSYNKVIDSLGNWL
ncbi:chemotaxis protein CheC [Cellulosilyticum sp. I15G10I2]|uniref:chemotaxis protein CheC n=1 Tax=Cellulosilyticum sp. I15G10I2 TaxID=1892843 RepID=UPI0009F17038|nr:chemotaxis protein CheC [Cellulosilyticum sp. I15G10I2]